MELQGPEKEYRQADGGTWPYVSPDAAEIARRRSVLEAAGVEFFTHGYHGGPADYWGYRRPQGRTMGSSHGFTSEQEAVDFLYDFMRRVEGKIND